MDIDARDRIVRYLKSDGRNLSWLSIKTNIPYRTLYSILTLKDRTLSDENRRIINKTLKTNF